MGVIVTRSIGTGSTATAGCGVFTPAEKLALQMEMEFKTAYASYYKEFVYIDGGVNDGTLVSAAIWIDPVKTTRLFTKDFTYEIGGGGKYSNLAQTLLHRDSDSAQLLKIFGYDNDDNLASVTISASPFVSAGECDWTEVVQDAVADLLTAGPNIQLTYDDNAGSLEISGANWGGYINDQIVAASASLISYIDTVSAASVEADNQLRNEFDWTYTSIVDTNTGATSYTLTSSIPNNAKAVEVLMLGVSTNTNSQPPIVRLGDAGGVETTGYAGVVRGPTGETAVSNGFYPFRTNAWNAADLLDCRIRLTRWDENLNTWFADSLANDGAQLSTFSGKKTTSEVMTTIQLTTPGGTATFDAGQARVRYRNIK